VKIIQEKINNIKTHIDNEENIVKSRIRNLEKKVKDLKDNFDIEEKKLNGFKNHLVKKIKENEFALMQVYTNNVKIKETQLISLENSIKVILDEMNFQINYINNLEAKMSRIKRRPELY
jgi:hypothetical protein